MRLKTSRPNLSVPRGCSFEVERRSCSRFCSAGLCGAIVGAKNAVATSRRRIARPKKSANLFAIGNPRVYEAIDDVGHKVDQEIRSSDHENTSLNQGIVPCLDRLNREAAKPRPGEDGLGDDRSCEKSAKLESYDCDNRKERVAESML